jgi:hypothetical protein
MSYVKMTDFLLAYFLMTEFLMAARAILACETMSLVFFFQNIIMFNQHMMKRGKRHVIVISNLAQTLCHSYMLNPAIYAAEL